MDLENLKKEEIIEVQDLIQEIEKLNKKLKKLQHNIGKRKKCFGYIIHFYDGVENGYIDDGFFIINEANDYCVRSIIPITDVMRIEELTNAKLTSIDEYKYKFTWNYLFE